jgi:GTPase SAR1 family protein
MQEVNIALLGDDMSKRKDLMRVFAFDAFAGEYPPSCFDQTISTSLLLDDTPISLSLWSPEADVPPAMLSLMDNHLFFFCFSLGSRASLRYAEELWEMFREHIDATVVLVGTDLDLRRSADEYDFSPALEKLQRSLSCSAYDTWKRSSSSFDLSGDSISSFDSPSNSTTSSPSSSWRSKEKERKSTIVTKEEGIQTARRMGAKAYYECSVVTRENVDEIFLECADLMLSIEKKKKVKTLNLLTKTKSVQFMQSC